MIALGAMSGTSTDGIDIAAIQIDTHTQEMRFLGVHSTGFTDDLRCDLLDLQRVPFQSSRVDRDPLDFLLTTRKALTEAYASATHELLSMLGLDATDVRVLGAHGQTLRHRPDAGYTYQMLDGALLACRTQLDVVCDFRSKDVALGGQGAPLVPAFHQAWLNGRGIRDRTAVLNLGGFSNLTVLNGPGAAVTGGDCGPANVLMDAWARRAFRRPMDEGGEIAAMGEPNVDLLETMWAHRFFAQTWPKSTGRDEFSEDWFNRCLSVRPDLSAEDVMATLLALSVRAVKSCLPVTTEQVYVCGGGARNETFLNQLRFECAPVEVLPIENLGLPAQAVEAAAFAWLAARHVDGLPGNCPAVTGANRDAVLGAFHQAA